MYPRIVGSLSLMCGDAHLAEELAQDAFAKLCRDWWRVRRMDHPEAWLHKVAINLATSHFRRRGAERRARARLEARPTLPNDEDHASSLALRRSVAGLPPRQKAAVVLRYYVDLPFAKVAELLGVTESTAKSLVAKAVERLRADGALDTREEASDVIRHP
ncbi:MAG TPA: sigma-70 family RNA polymerase sigma factor [Fimbriimonadaceae bacterium]|nr:sigma-70 family RNA polymerase sigma factor [Fimbriimonadaceae bacterium]